MKKSKICGEGGREKNFGSKNLWSATLSYTTGLYKSLKSKQKLRPSAVCFDFQTDLCVWRKTYTEIRLTTLADGSVPPRHRGCWKIREWWRTSRTTAASPCSGWKICKIQIWAPKSTAVASANSPHALLATPELRAPTGFPEPWPERCRLTQT